ncbi:Uncharacterised protein [Mycobacteroides abscessus subsp. abscessus]|nr:Uncharacterised protein [Mycobacteroides abscessus subsp. abscessus]SHX84710.1 Uncharacterised protein [Mycobacteroides abscessus subsp. abscessus]
MQPTATKSSRGTTLSSLVPKDRVPSPQAIPKVLMARKAVKMTAWAPCRMSWDPARLAYFLARSQPVMPRMNAGVTAIP